MANIGTVSNVYFDMVEKAYPYLIGFNCGYDHARTVLYSPATQNCSVNLYGVFSQDTDFSQDVTKSLGVYCVWKGPDTTKDLRIEDCPPLEPLAGAKAASLINIPEYMESFNSLDKKMLATQVMNNSARYWIEDDWYPEKEAFFLQKNMEAQALTLLENLAEEEYDFSQEDLDDYDDEDDDEITLDLGDISEEDYNNVMNLLNILGTGN